MSKLKHMPAPWTRVECDIVDSNGKSVPENEANQRLILTAPDMLDALKKIESCLAPENNDIAAQAVRAAIAKAEGRDL